MNSIINGERQEIIESVIQSAIQAVDPYNAIRSAIIRNGESLTINDFSYDLSSYSNVFLIAIGKASQKMAKATDDLFGEYITRSIILTKHIDSSLVFPEKYEILSGGHPVPTAESVAAAGKILSLVRTAGKSDLVIFLISGGGSSLMTLPEEGMTLEDMQQCSKLLLSSGADIREFNTVRKHLDQVKGGKLALAANPATILTCIISDVVGSPLDTIASGPTVPDPTTFEDAYAVISRYQISDKIPESVISVLQKGLKQQIQETLKPGGIQDSSRSILIADNRTAAVAAIEKAKSYGFHTLLLTTSLTGEARYAGKFLASILQELSQNNSFLSKPALVIAGGETTVTLTGTGIGGRNLETALGAVEILQGVEDVAFVTLATDGEDGPTDAAGAIVTGNSFGQGQKIGLNVRSFLLNNDSYSYFLSLDGLIKTGITGTNVNDLNFLFCF
ncbi:MAG: glycerate kinase [Flexilinea sp.]